MDADADAEAMAMTVTVRREVVLPVAPEELWPALTEAEQMTAWFGADVELDLRPGGRMTFRWSDATRRGVVETVEPNRRLAFRWAEPGADGVASESRVELRLEAVADGTRLRVTESGLDGAGGMPAMVASLGAERGWGRVLQRLVVVYGAVHPVSR
jgi:uncharacterized protein YndB with AHSA1/START domain